MPPKRKLNKSAAPRAKRARAAAPIPDEGAAPIEEPTHHTGYVHEHDADGDADADADGEMEDERVEDDADGDGDVDEDAAHEEDLNDDADDDYMSDTEPMPTPPRGRGRGRPRKIRGAVPNPTRSSPRKAAQQAHPLIQQPTPEPAPKTVRGRKPGRPRGRGRGNGRGAAPGPVAAAADDEGDDEADGDDDDTAAAPHDEQSHAQLQPQPSPIPPPQVQQPHPAQQPPQPSPFPHAVYPPYPSYPSHAPPFTYVYADGRPYLPLRPDASQHLPAPSAGHIFSTPQTSFATPAGSFAYDGAPQGNPFPPFGPVYGVGRDDRDDDDDEGDGEAGEQLAQQVRRRAAKAGGRAGRGDHVACHFCRGRKLKCDGRRPTCGHCALRSLACAYDEHVRRRGPGKKEKNARRVRPGNATTTTTTTTQSNPPHEVVVADLGGSVLSQSQAPSGTEDPRPKRRRRAPTQSQPQPQNAVLRFDEDVGVTGTPGAKPASAAYGVESNERLGYYYTPDTGPGFAPGYEPGAGYAGYGYPRGNEVAEDGEHDDGEHGAGVAAYEAEDGRPSQSTQATYGPPTDNSFAQWPAEAPGTHM